MKTREAPAFLLKTNDRLPFSIKVKNVGERATKAGGTLRVIDPQFNQSFHQPRFRTPTIRPGRSHVAEVVVLPRYMISFQQYRTRACVASIRDPNVRNNCRNGPKFTFIPRIWRGRVELAAPFDPFDGSSAMETAVAEAAFTFNGAGSAGFTYRGSGPVTYSASGTYGGCDYGGGSTLNIDQGRSSLLIRPDLSSYNGTGLEADEHYTITVNCGVLGPRPPEQGPKNQAWWTSPTAKSWGQDKRRIKDTNADILGRRWTWDLAGE